jgi:hypothetical protein
MAYSKTLAHVWATEAEAQAGQLQVDTALGLPSGNTLHYQSIQPQDDFWWMMADNVTINILGVDNFQIIDEEIPDTEG